MKKQTIIQILSIILFLFTALISTLMLTSHVLNPYIVPFKTTFISFLTSFIGNLAILSFIILIVLIIIKKPYRRIYTLGIISIILSILMYGCRVYTRYYSSFFSFRTLSVFKNPAADLGLSIGVQVLKEFFTSFSFLSILPGILLIVYALVFKKKHEINIKNPNNHYLHKSVSLALSLIFSALMIASFKISANKKWPYNNDLAMYGCQNAGTYNYYIYELVGFNFNNKYTKKYKKDDITVKIKEYDKNDSNYINFLDEANSDKRLYEGLFSGKNLEIIQLESINTFAVDLKINGEYLMPNLNKIINDSNSYYFKKFYSSVGQGKTADAELSVMTNANPSGYTTLHWDYEDTKYDFDALPELFKNKYNGNAYSFHGDVAGFYNRTMVHEELFGFNKYYSLEDYLLTHPSEENDPSSYINGWVDDEVVLNWVDTFKENETNPYLMYAIMTVSHTPFTSNPLESELEEKINIKNKMLYRYLAYMVYVDNYLGRLYEKMQNDPNTIYVLYGDHGSYLSKRELKELFGKQSEIDLLERQMQVPALIFDASGVLNHETSGVMENNLVRSEIDLFTTINDLFDLGYSGIRIGVNALSNEKTFAYDANTFTVVTDDYIYYVKTGEYKKYTDIATKLMKEQIEKIKKFKLYSDIAKEYSLYKKED